LAEGGKATQQQRKKKRPQAKTIWVKRRGVLLGLPGDAMSLYFAAGRGKRNPVEKKLKKHILRRQESYRGTLNDWSRYHLKGKFY